MFCPKCGKQNNGDAKFCQYCAFDLSEINVEKEGQQKVDEEIIKPSMQSDTNLHEESEVEKRNDFKDKKDAIHGAPVKAGNGCITVFLPMILYIFFVFFIFIIVFEIGEEDNSPSTNSPSINSPSINSKDNVQQPQPDKVDWITLKKKLVLDYQGKIQSIEHLDSATCWAALNPQISNQQAVEIAENIGYYIRNATGGMNGQTVSVHVFIGTTHIAVARPSIGGTKFTGKLDIKEWDY
jgi:hypothetical protein